MSEGVEERFESAPPNGAETDRFRELVRGSTPHSRYVLHVLTALALDDDTDADGSHDPYSRRLRANLPVRRSRRSLRRVRVLRHNRAGHSGGSAEGTGTNHTPLEDPTGIRQVLTETATPEGA